jgi:DNA invertase Pin-like site-specific DNA recombinase
LDSIKVAAAKDTDLIAVVGLAVKSSPDPNDSTGAQTALIEAAVEQAGGREVVAKFAEENVSGWKGDRGPETERALVAAEQLAGDGRTVELWLRDSARAARGSGRKDEARSLLEVYVRLKRAGVRMRSVNDDDFLADETRVAMASTVANKYSEDLSGWTSAGRERLALAGHWNGRAVDGYRPLPRVRPEPPQVEFDPDRHPIVRGAFDLCLDGMDSSGAIQRALNESGQLARRMVRMPAGQRQGRPVEFELIPWTARRVREMLRLPFYAGLQIHRREVVGLGNWPVLIELDEWEEVQLRLDGRRRSVASRKRPAERRSHNSLLGNLCRCGDCDSPMHIIVNRPRKVDGVRTVRAHCRASREGQGCDAPRIDTRPLEERLLASLDDLGVDLDRWIAERAASTEVDRGQIERAIAAAEAELSRLEAQTANTRAVAREQMGAGNAAAAEVAAEALAQIGTERAQAEHRLAEMRAALEASDPTSDAVLDFYNRIQAAISGRLGDAEAEDTATLNERLREVLDHIVVTLDGDEVRMRPVLSRRFLEEVAGGELADPDAVAEAYEANVGLPAQPTADGLAVDLPPLRPVAGGQSWARPLSRWRA